MPIYSHSQLSTYEDCPLRFKLSYRDRIKRDVESIEAFMGTVVHETLRKCYDAAKLTKVDSLDDMLDCYDSLWQKAWHDDIVIARKNLTADHYQASGRKMLETYYRKHAPFDEDVTIDTEMHLRFHLDENRKYQLQGYVDRLSRTADGVHHIHDYKTSGHLPGQSDADADRQLALYQIGIQKKWPDVKDVKLVWHYLAFDRDLVSVRSAPKLDELSAKTMRLIDEIESAIDFPPKETGLCEWCEYPDLCPNRKHFHVVEALPENKYFTEPGFTLVNRFAELRDKAREIDDETAEVKEALIEYARREGVNAIRGADRKVRVKFEEKLRFPGKSEPGREDLDKAITAAGKWTEVSQLDTSALCRAVEAKLWEQSLIDEIVKHGKIEQTGSVYLSKLKEGEE